MTRIITVEIIRPPLRSRIAWYMLQAKLYVLKPFTPRMTADEWYAANCPPYAGQAKPWM